MRMWMVDPRVMCRRHLLGEHVELHMFVGSINKGVDMTGYLADNLLEPMSITSRHWQLVQEMEARGYRHKSPMTAFNGKQPDWTRFEPKTYYLRGFHEFVIDRQASLTELMRRCPECRARYEEVNGGAFQPHHPSSCP